MVLNYKKNSIHPDEGIAMGAARFGSGKVKLCRMRKHAVDIDAAKQPLKRAPEETHIDQRTKKQKLTCSSEVGGRDSAVSNVNETDDALPKKRNRLDYTLVKNYRITNRYPPRMTNKNHKANFRKQCRPFGVLNGKLWYKKLDTEEDEIHLDKGANSKSPKNTTLSAFHDKQLQSLSDEELRHRGFRIAPLLEPERKKILELVHTNEDTCVESRALGSHNGRDKSIALLEKRYYWCGMKEDMREYWNSYTVCEKENTSILKIVPKLRPVGVPSKVMAQIGVDLMTLPCVDGYNYIYVAIDYFSKWVEARPAERKDALSVAKFIYEDIICRHGCPAIQINDQGRELVNTISEELHRMTGTKQRITSAYHPQANGMVERQNRTIKSRLVKVLSSISEWPAALPGVLFACRTAMHRSTNYSPFYLVYMREPVLPLDVREMSEVNGYDVDDFLLLSDNGATESEDPMDMTHFNTVLKSMMDIRSQVHEKASENIKNMQKRYKKDYDLKHQTNYKHVVGDHVFLLDPKQAQRKGKGDALTKRSGPYTVLEIVDESRVVLKNDETGKVLKSSYNMEHIFHCKTVENENPDDPDEVGGPKTSHGGRRPETKPEGLNKQPIKICDSVEDNPEQPQI